MKNLIYLTTALLFMLAACNKDMVEPVNNDGIDQANYKKSKTKPMKVWFYSIATSENEGLVGGHATHVGNVILNNSPYEKTTVGFEYPYLTEMITGYITAANGDTFNYSLLATINILDNGLTGTTTILGGTGKFYNATGTVIINGTVNPDDGSANWTGEGTITFP